MNSLFQSISYYAGLGVSLLLGCFFCIQAWRANSKAKADQNPADAVAGHANMNAAIISFILSTIAFSLNQSFQDYCRSSGSQAAELKQLLLDRDDTRTNLRDITRPDEVVNCIVGQVEKVCPGIDQPYETRVLRGRFVPGPLPGVLSPSDQLVGNSLPGKWFKLEEFIGYPPQPEAGAPVDADLISQRRQMGLFLFRYLMSLDESKDLLQRARIKSQITIFYVPQAFRYDFWSITNTRSCVAGRAYYEDWRWKGADEHPQPQTVVLVNHERLAKSLRAELQDLHGMGRRFLEQELKKLPYLRDPCTIFATGIPEDGLKPKSLGQVKEDTEKRSALWQQDSEGPGATRQKPPTLSELEALVQELERCSVQSAGTPG